MISTLNLYEEFNLYRRNGRTGKWIEITNKAEINHVLSSGSAPPATYLPTAKTIWIGVIEEIGTKLQIVYYKAKRKA